jgi:hypothetical protein
MYAIATHIAKASGAREGQKEAGARELGEWPKTACLRAPYARTWQISALIHVLTAATTYTGKICFPFNLDSESRLHHDSHNSRMFSNLTFETRRG